jgi:hypothetical protein
LLPFSPEAFVFSSAVEKCKNQKVQDYNFACGFIWSETWSLTLKEEYRLWVFESRVLRRMFGPKWNEVTGAWRKLHNKELHDLCSSPSVIRIMKSRMKRCADHVVRLMEEKRKL